MKQDQNSEKLLSRRADHNDDKAIRREGGEAGGEREERRGMKSVIKESSSDRRGQ